MTRVAVITGAAQGIGRETARVLAERGFALVLLDLREVEGDFGASTLKLTGDVSSEEDVKRFVTRTTEKFGRVDVLVNNAGISCIVPAEDTTTEQFRRVLDVNLLGPFLLSREFGRVMLERGEGAIVNVASVAGLAGVSDRSAYNASKHGLIGLTRTLAGEWGGRGVRVNAVCPGWVKTEMDEKDAGSGAYTSADIERRVPMGRFATPRDVAEAIAFLADADKSAFVNGVALSVDGGWYADASWESLRLGKR
ncbi:SDR family NAD(P)-dependent oxidoreductase [Deinococcus yavapaiensis]|uniref:NAD(P)-dependent dehydrogenase (Short-subunit alcohol dehydrogenase family) n=1 Tax=Deinococcus yavapaiensis KR-236 TaxID=694435 RepID=A0A318SL34_9DEIO|nr:SDR family oxidoreductase [Deinococcus yavapaiensis]PYE55219.1 NAD(P)-dependent dehydrogenase (short-subunit alcohol dehydrogenase family) [Deinococcus yavapaiensis KR-236]